MTPEQAQGAVLPPVVAGRRPLPVLPTYLGRCCQVWVLAACLPPGRCGDCGERVTYLGPDPHSTGGDAA